MEEVRAADLLLERVLVRDHARRIHVRARARPFRLRRFAAMGQRPFDEHGSMHARPADVGGGLSSQEGVDDPHQDGICHDSFPKGDRKYLEPPSDHFLHPPHLHLRYSRSGLCQRRMPRQHRKRHSLHREWSITCECGRRRGLLPLPETSRCGEIGRSSYLRDRRIVHTEGHERSSGMGSGLHHVVGADVPGQHPVDDHGSVHLHHRDHA
mmetsp:Transcript_40193/g.126499  ORF Transcript_40193/g.126499 Transcript_40193/m.126499 type:complete len:210 (-) Transcript_40193:583-1212(-)